MSMTRANAATYLAGAFPNEIALIGVPATDATPGLKTTIDRALELIGVAEADIATAVVADADAQKYRRALDYAFLRYCLGFARGRAKSITIPGVSKTYGDWVKELMDAIADAEAEAGLLIPSLNQYGFGSINLDFIEPGSNE